jgi:hypothetical protein
MTDTNTIWIVVALVAVAVAIVLAVAVARQARARREMLRERFGPEYDRAVRQYGTKADRVLAARARRVDQIERRELNDADRQRFTELWSSIQQQFVDDPRTAVTRASDLIKDVMRARGYPADDAFEQRAADLSVDHPDVVQHYRAARELAQTKKAEGMDTEELRQAVVHYRVLFADLLQPEPARATGPTVLRPAPAR